MPFLRSGPLDSQLPSPKFRSSKQLHVRTGVGAGRYTVFDPHRHSIYGGRWRPLAQTQPDLQERRPNTNMRASRTEHGPLLGPPLPCNIGADSPNHHFKPDPLNPLPQKKKEKEHKSLSNLPPPNKYLNKWMNKLTTPNTQHHINENTKAAPCSTSYSESEAAIKTHFKLGGGRARAKQCPPAKPGAKRSEHPSIID